MTESDQSTNGIYQPPERETCERCYGMGVITERLDGPDWCPDCDGSGYADGWADYVERAVNSATDH